jgi:hypothetical protein
MLSRDLVLMAHEPAPKSALWEAARDGFVDGVRYYVDLMGLLDWDFLRLRSPREAQARAVNGTQHISIGFVGNCKKDGGLGLVGLGKRKLAILDGTGVVLWVHG